MALNIKGIKPLFTALITTMDRYEEDEFDGSFIKSNKTKGSLKEYQKVVAVGNNVRDIQVGDMVSINPTRFGVKKHQEGSIKDGIIGDNPVVSYKFDIVEMNNIPYLLLQDRDINYIISDYEEIKDPPKPGIIIPDKKIIGV